MRAAVLIPVKAFAEAKLRLAPALTSEERAALARAMAGCVVAAAAPLPVAVVCDDAEVAEWATALGVDVVWAPQRGLDGAVTFGVAALADSGADRVIVAHSDLPHASGLAHVADFDGATFVPDRANDGTNVACIPARCGFTFSYGPGSFRRHVAEARRLDLPVRVSRRRSLQRDIDLPDDLAGLVEVDAAALRGFAR